MTTVRPTRLAASLLATLPLRGRDKRVCGALTILVALMLLSAPLGGCANWPELRRSAYSGSGNGDFGRVRRSLARDDIHDWVGPAAVPGTGDPPWRHQLTDEERKLRDLAYPLIEPPYDRQRWYSVLAENGFWALPFPFPDRSTYATRLFQTAYRSQTARYSKLIDDIRNDVTRLDPFFATARYVSDMDAKRGQALQRIPVTGEEHVNTVNRMRENEGIIRWVRASLRERAASYQLALERMVLAAPAPMAVEAERSLALLNQRLSGYGA
jgi:hypothetical protein